MGCLKFRDPHDEQAWKQVFDRAFAAGCNIRNCDIATAFSDATEAADKYLVNVRMRNGEPLELAFDIERPQLCGLIGIRSPDDEPPLHEAHRKWLHGEHPQ